MNAAPRIAFLSEHASPVALLGGEDAGGQNVYVDQVSSGLAALGCQVDVFTRRDRDDAPERIDWAPGVRVVNLDAGPRQFIPKDDIWPHMPAFRDAIRRFAAADGIRYDLYHGNFWMSGWAACELGAATDAPVVQIFHATGLTKRREQGAADTSPPDRIAIEREIVQRADRLIAQCPAEARELIEDYGADPSSVAVIPSAVDPAVFRPVDQTAARQRLDLPIDQPVIAYVGRLLPRKDVRNIVRAVGLLARQHSLDGPLPLLLIVGGESTEPDPVVTPEIGELQQLASDCGVSDLLRFTGRRQRNELRWCYGAADVAITTPWYEPFGLTPLEAMACGVPVIGSAVGGITFTVADGETGLLVPPRDPVALAAAIRDLLANAGRRERMGRAARDQVLAGFIWPLVSRRTLDLYHSLSGSGKSSLAPLIRTTEEISTWTA
jgi:D-inositol-3-phosphate glycosyltransferase